MILCTFLRNSHHLPTHVRALGPMKSLGTRGFQQCTAGCDKKSTDSDETGVGKTPTVRMWTACDGKVKVVIINHEKGDSPTEHSYDNLPEAFQAVLEEGIQIGWRKRQPTPRKSSIEKILLYCELSNILDGFGQTKVLREAEVKVKRMAEVIIDEFK
ncbi:hypothetical protein BC936DRAFT_147111 [Jimgerdemannia flammicorona]|uniref:Uncharacterized protein n=2 Tax=Jimgerdemannia flammicorona TaxID=994334 RepID=A0A433Q3W5_9FUNG|nr:hypothetical protein BC936DRAFT_147111 [Jimgerdemannia flammicorona]RUS24354.1 hypothetical protein BC938DRAFT_473719 [Jimgerdemannia flammicorona]